MMKPTSKAKGIDDRITAITGKSRVDVIGKGCMTCAEPNLEFRDDLSRREYRISGMCQTCQDSTFGLGGEE